MLRNGLARFRIPFGSTTAFGTSPEPGRIYATGVYMIEIGSRPQPESDFPRRIATWSLILLGVYVAYSATHFWGRPDAVAGFLAMLAERLPVMVAQILPPAAFAAALNGCGIFGGGTTGLRRCHWVLLAILAMATYALPSLVAPMFAEWTGSDWPLPTAVLEAARSERAAAEAASGNEAARHLRRMASALATLLVPLANAAFVLLAAVLGDLTGRATRELSVWSRYATRWLSGGLLFATFWIPAPVADELVGYDAAWGGLLFVLPLCVPLAAAGILFASVRPDRGSAR